MLSAKRSKRLKAIFNLMLCLVFGLITAFVFTTAALAQKGRPAGHTEKLARSKAERLATLSMAQKFQTANQADYDVIYYDLDLELDPVAKTVTGTVEVRAEVLSSFLTVMDLDLLDNMAVTQVLSGGISAGFTHSADILTVTLDRTYTQGETVVVIVDYNGLPSASYGSFGFDTYNGQPMIWSLSEPFGARSWWPCKDIPADKADSVDVRITVPSALTVASNGTLRSIVDNGATRTWWWHEGYPITTYLVSIAIHPYTTFSHWYRYSTTDSMEVQYYVFPDHYASVQATYALTVPMIELFAGLFGEYPFLEEKYGHAEFLWGGGMEHQTITSLGGWSEYLIVHELAHMWWGDMITCEDFHHIWLNEGFATYSEALWSEHTYGMETYHADMALAKYLGSGTIYVEDPSDFGSIFHGGLSYNKASWVLHMLRHVVGDTIFFDILQTYYADTRYQYGTATTEEFRDLCEAVSGMDLGFFFHQWIYEEYYPSYSYNWSATPNGGYFDVDLTIGQSQSNYVFTMPVDVTIETTSGDTTIVVWDSLAVQVFTLAVAGEPTKVLLDKDEWILRLVEEPLLNPTFDRGILLVNGVNWGVYGADIFTAYEDSIFWGDHSITFWDCFDEPGSGYPANLPAPLGHGAVPADTIQQFSTVIWIGNNYQGDWLPYINTPIKSYINAGGNLLLMSRLGQDFLTEPLRDYLGITWAENAYNTIYNCIAARPGLVDIPLITSNSYCAVFDTTFDTSETTLIFKETASFAEHRGLGAWRKPAAGGSHRADGAQFVFISGRPYRWGHDESRANCEYILEDFFGEPYEPATAIETAGPRITFGLYQNYPNPFNPHTTIRFSLPAKAHVDLRVYDVTGRLVKVILAREKTAGFHSAAWDGTNRSGSPVASGVYFYKIRAGANVATRKMVLLR